MCGNTYPIGTLAEGKRKYLLIKYMFHGKMYKLHKRIIHDICIFLAPSRSLTIDLVFLEYDTDITDKKSFN